MRERRSSVYGRPRKISCRFKRLARARSIHEKSGLEEIQAETEIAGRRYAEIGGLALEDLQDFFEFAAQLTHYLLGNGDVATCLGAFQALPGATDGETLFVQQ